MNLICVGFEVLTTVIMKSAIFWDISPCSPLSVNRRFGGTYCLYLQGRKNKLSKKPAWKQVACDSEDGGDRFSETSVDTERTTRPYIPEDGTLQSDLCSECGTSEPSRAGTFI
jgi:hypothetical protein